jgi:hypothetical protein
MALFDLNIITHLKMMDLSLLNVQVKERYLNDPDLNNFQMKVI